MKISRAALAALCLAAATLAGSPAWAATREEQRLQNVTQVLKDTQQMPDMQVPDWLVQRAQGVAIFPEVVKVGLGVGGRGGKGILVVRHPDGSWSNPSFVTLAGGSFGWQAGVQASDIMLVFTTRKGIEGITGGKFTLGGDASVAVGPVGRSVSGATDVTFDAEVYSYSRAKGLFGGIAIDGTVISIDHKANAAFYGKPGVLASEIFAVNAPPAPAVVQPLKSELQRLTRGLAPVGAQSTGTAAAAPAHGAAPANGATTSGATEERGLESGGAATFPLEGDKPKGDQPPR
jgi:lipid-binding SYLF domain-containing protein